MADPIEVWDGTTANHPRIDTRVDPDARDFDKLSIEVRKVQQYLSDGVLYDAEGNQVVGAQQANIPTVSGTSGDVDPEARATIDLILALLEAHGLAAPPEED